MFQDSAQRLDVHQDVRGLPRDRRSPKQEFDPYGAPPRPNVRTTEDYLREREAQERANKSDS